MSKTSMKKLYEPLFDEKEFRLNILPIKYPDIWHLYKTHLATFWKVDEVDMSSDYSAWIKLSDNERYFIKMILAFFAASDGIVSMNLTERFINDVKIPEVQFFYRFQAMMEDIHNTMYNIIIDTYIKDVDEKQKTFEALENFECINKKAKWAMKWIESEDNYAKRLVAFAAVEGIFFSGAFCSIFWLSDRNIGLKGLILSNQWISRDESLHCVVPETKILTDAGYKKIIDCENKETTIWNGDEWSIVIPVKTGTNKEILKVKLDNYMELECTKKHKWIVATEHTKKKKQEYKFEEKYTEELVPGDILMKYDMPIIEVKDPEEFLYPYTQGFFCADGTYEHKYKKSDHSLNPNKVPLIKVKRLDKKILIQHINYKSYVENDTEGYMVIRLDRHKIKEKFFVPVNYSTKTKLDWLAGLADGDGSLKFSKTNRAGILICSINLEFLKEIQLMLSTMGIIAHIKLHEKENEKMIKGKLYNCKENYTISITCIDVIRLKKLGFSPKRLDISNIDTESKMIAYNQYIRVKEIVNENRISDTYCFTEPKNHTGIFNGIMTAQCDFACHIYKNLIKNKLPVKEINAIIDEAVEIEIEFICDTLKVGLLGMNSKLMIQYIKFVADRLLIQLGYSKIYNTTNPFGFMEKISLQGKTNFFEDRVSQYQKGFSTHITNTDGELNIVDDF